MAQIGEVRAMSRRQAQAASLSGSAACRAAFSRHEPRRRLVEYGVDMVPLLGECVARVQDGARVFARRVAELMEHELCVAPVIQAVMRGAHGCSGESVTAWRGGGGTENSRAGCALQAAQQRCGDDVHCSSKKTTNRTDRCCGEQKGV
eukprot:CAMPEP_0119399376 /NCGR_PEP_ID=MMETSP1334-20130426/141327_1 /TAXON_ID=127549 /ORGANISM="Calcidiscus leptoporus, Strain RCC1130" /LENGTH=147 /DNA_ID=CAMNT_0007423267 /DNA_START=137 /DNA_END=580 /DNA_ORIENTATION=+